MDISKGIPLSTNVSRRIADLNLPQVKFPPNFARTLGDAAEGLRKAEAIARGESRLDADNSPEKAVKTVIKDGQLVATIYKSGVVEVSNKFADKLRNLNLPSDASSQLGTIRAAMIADAVGGEISDVTSSSHFSHARFSITA